MVHALLMKTLEPPIFVVDGEDVLIFRSREGAENSLEPPVRGLRAFDAIGNRLSLATCRERWLGIERDTVLLSPTEGEVTGADELAGALRRYLAGAFRDQDLSSVPLSSLVKFAAELAK